METDGEQQAEERDGGDELEDADERLAFVGLAAAEQGVDSLVEVDADGGDQQEEVDAFLALEAGRVCEACPEEVDGQGELLEVGADQLELRGLAQPLVLQTGQGRLLVHEEEEARDEQ